jgi:hypothetical protein
MKDCGSLLRTPNDRQAHTLVLGYPTAARQPNHNAPSFPSHRRSLSSRGLAIPRQNISNDGMVSKRTRTWISQPKQIAPQRKPPSPCIVYRSQKKTSRASGTRKQKIAVQIHLVVIPKLPLPNVRSSAQRNIPKRRTCGARKFGIRHQRLIVNHSHS